jgi:tRNA uridine 5-carbamoylmethylation protein Kti12
VSLPLLIVVTGMPSSRKTTVAEGLARRFRVALIAKGEIKESVRILCGHLTTRC